GRPAWFAGAMVETEIRRRGGLAPGSRLAGPAIVEDAGSTVLVPPGATARVDAAGLIHITLAEGGSAA
ncbi:MAG: hypothetical protein JO264_07200, partial [Acidisphaera sp.]|nr:hypothetical protein [Acidisphaera sp.]